MSGDSSDPLLWRRLVSGIAVAIAVVIGFVIYLQPGHRAHDELTRRHLETPSFQPAPPSQPASQTLATVWRDLQSESGSRFLNSLLPTQAGALWIALIVTIVVGFDTSRLRSGRNLELVALSIVGVLLFDVLRFFDFLTDPTYFRVMDWVFSAIVATSAALAARAAWRIWHPDPSPWQPHLPARALMLLTLVLLSLTTLIVVVREPDDAGFYTNLGGQRLRERGMFPYGDPLITGSPAAAYGPLLFLSHLPFQWLIDPTPVNAESPDHALQDGQVYRLPAMQASQLATLVYHLIAVAALVAIGRQLANDQVAWGLAALYCGSAYVIGVGGPREMIGGLTFISHTAAPALALLAFACLGRPFFAGLFLSMSVATVFYPLFFIPAWTGYYSRTRGAAWRFVAGLAVAAIVIGGPMLARSRAIEGVGLLGTIVRETLGHHQSSDAYGLTPFGFWGRRGGVRAWLQQEVVHGQAMTTPMFLIVALVSALSFFPARRAIPQQLALLSAVCALLVVIWKILGTGVYVTWYYPFLLIGFFAYGQRALAPSSTVDSHRQVASR